MCVGAVQQCDDVPVGSLCTAACGASSCLPGQPCALVLGEESAAADPRMQPAAVHAQAGGRGVVVHSSHLGFVCVASCHSRTLWHCWATAWCVLGYITVMVCLSGQYLHCSSGSMWDEQLLGRSCPSYMGPGQSAAAGPRMQHVPYLYACTGFWGRGGGRGY